VAGDRARERGQQSRILQPPPARVGWRKQGGGVSGLRQAQGVASRAGRAECRTPRPARGRPERGALTAPRRVRQLICAKRSHGSSFLGSSPRFDARVGARSPPEELRHSRRLIVGGQASARQATMRADRDAHRKATGSARRRRARACVACGEQAARERRDGRRKEGRWENDGGVRGAPGATRRLIPHQVRVWRPFPLGVLFNLMVKGSQTLPRQQPCALPHCAW
jgi:hypothetical protein